MAERAAFFYAPGTLMAPQVLHRVCYGSSKPPAYQSGLLTVRPAILPSYERHRVRHADYPAIIPHAHSAVRGTVVTGLTDADIWRLDIFEGDDYERVTVTAKILVEVGDETGKGNVQGEEVRVETYVWIAGEEMLEKGEWDFAEFQKEKIGRWIGEEGEPEYAEVDDAVKAQSYDPTGGRGMNGHITNALEGQTASQGVLKNVI
ncbi:hypothetical protein B0A49_06165 [Cryomyces minteri]|uniref:Putative gamma-glutamylcyclotransferase n=1 Tax=Cryomyces minteri TaxID=331657 RepID=A0A4U0WYG1_9PEZI|nr:hypothetical protein B0A49_06165 [Cryomyces minteri]